MEFVLLYVPESWCHQHRSWSPLDDRAALPLFNCHYEGRRRSGLCFFFFVRLQVNDTKGRGRWRDEGSPAGLCLVFKSTSGGPAWPPFSASMIYHKWNPLTAAFSVAR